MSDTTKSVDDELLMDAYYYSFDRTGVIEIDRILSAVAIAGKRHHNTEDWQEDVVGAIQKAANDAAQLFTKQLEEAYKKGYTDGSIATLTQDTKGGTDGD